MPQKPWSRRHIVRAGVFLPLASLAEAATPAPSLTGTSLRVLIPRHPLSSYDDGIRTLGSNWATAEGVALTIDIVPETDIPAAFAAEIEIGAGHDLIGTNLPLLHHANDLLDLVPLYDLAAARFGPATDVCNAATRLPDGSRPAFSIAYAPAPLIYRRSIWERYGLPNGPASWEQLRETGAQIWNEEGMNVGFGLSPEPGSERFAQMLLTAFGGAMLDAEGAVALDSPETVEATRFAVSLYRESMSPESLDWATDRPATLLADSIASIISADISALRLAQLRDAETGNDLFLAPPPAGPSGLMFPSSPATSYRSFHIPRFAQNPDAARAFALMLAASSEALLGANQLSDRPAYGSLVPSLVQSGGWLDADPYGSVPPEKLAMLKSSAAWTSHPGAPGPAGPLAARAGAEFLLSRMLAQAARGDLAPEDAVTAAANRLRQLGED
jgi:ABC-type glycerol-3-phosphate transport system substrate-binding protein